MSADKRSQGPTPTTAQQVVLDRIAAQRQRLRARCEARKQARAQNAAQMPEGASGNVLQAMAFLRQHPLVAVAAVAAVVVIGPRRCLGWAGVLLPRLLHFRR